MSTVIATVANIDPNSVCEEESCSQRGELYRDHRVSHTTKGAKKGMRGTCPHCQGRLHNTNDAAQLIAFQCLWRQEFGDKAKTTPVNASTLSQVALHIKGGGITAWADRSALHTILAGGAVALPKAAPAPTTTSSLAATAAPTPTSSSPSPVPSVAGPASGATASTPVVVDQAARDEKRRKLKAALAGAKVLP